MPTSSGYSFTEENYLKAIFFLSRNSEKGAATNDIAKRLATKASSVTDMVRKLSDKGLLTYEKYQGVFLTDQGHAIATNIIRKHRLWEVFLVEKLDFKWDEVHDIAEQLEHIQSPELTARLEAFLEYPKYDPHGDPIPDADGKFPKQVRTQLADFETGDELIVTGVKDSSPEFLQFLEQAHITLGTPLKITAVFPFDKSMQIATQSQEALNLSKQVTTNLFVTLSKTTI
ncbi:MAG: metal-dependent transcriptional regulator [Schleiferiaceae bacterium]|nr:metal-dependent transcriptional regulator [Schleiferiaceae bacterium]